jgi:hypothetical protein
MEVHFNPEVRAKLDQMGAPPNAGAINWSKTS